MHIADHSSNYKWKKQNINQVNFIIIWVITYKQVFNAKTDEIIWYLFNVLLKFSKTGVIFLIQTIKMKILICMIVIVTQKKYKI